MKTGDRVIFTSYAGTEVKLDGDTLLIMTEDDILALERAAIARLASTVETLDRMEPMRAKGKPLRN